MQIETYLFENGAWNKEIDTSLDSSNTLIIIFGSINISNIKKGIDNIIQAYPNSIILGVSSSGEIYNNEIFHDSLNVSIVKFSNSNFRVIVKEINEQNSFETGKSIINELKEKYLKSIFILSSIMDVNGSELTRGLSFNAPKNCVITGGLAGDGIEFSKTWILVGSKFIKKQIVALGLYGSSLRVSTDCKCGWSRFGLDRKVTSSHENIIYSIDKKPALELYKRYLGSYAQELPSAGLYFPFMLVEKGKKKPLLRAIRDIDEKNNSIVLSASIPQNSIVTFAKANLDELIDDAQEAAESLMLKHNKKQKALCIAINCIARKIVLKQEAGDEIEVVKDALGESVSLVGFYSYGEITSVSQGGCDFRNQSIMLILLYEEENNE